MELRFARRIFAALASLSVVAASASIASSQTVEQSGADALRSPVCGPKGSVAVTFKIGDHGQIVEPVTAGGDENSDNPAVRRAALAAIAKVRAADPLKNITEEFMGKTIKMRFAILDECKK
jgi:hypothetical protein